MTRRIVNKVTSLILQSSSRSRRHFQSAAPLSSSHIHRHFHALVSRQPNVKFYNNEIQQASRRATSLLNSSTALRYLSNNSSSEIITTGNRDDGDDKVEPIDTWEEEDEEVEPKIGDGGDGGGVVFQNCYWGERALSIAHEVLLQFDDDLKFYAFKTSPRGYVYVRLDKLSNDYGCPSMDQMESFSRQYKAKLDEVGAAGDIPNDLALEVSSPGAERLLKVPDDLDRFKDMPMRITYMENLEAKCQEKDGVFLLDSIDTESGFCVWKLADVKENRDPHAKGRPMSRKRKDWRLRLPYDMFKRVTLYLDY